MKDASFKNPFTGVKTNSVMMFSLTSALVTVHSAMPAGAQDEAPTGFSIQVDDKIIAADKTVLKLEKQTDKAEAGKPIVIKNNVIVPKPDVAIKFDGLDVRPQLDAVVLKQGSSVPFGRKAKFQTRMNYPAFVERGEVRIINPNALGGAATVKVVSVAPNASKVIDLPKGDDLIYVYRVYDAKGRFDETAPASISDFSGRGGNGSIGADAKTETTHRIPIFGAAVTVSGTHIAKGSVVRTLGENVRPDANGSFVVQRILPTGDHDVEVSVPNGPQIERNITVPASDLFYIGLLDLTFGKSLGSDLGEDEGIRSTGRVAGYVKGKIKGGYTLTAAVDTGEDDLGNLLKNLDKKNARSLIDRMGDSERYPVYGDDSTSENDAPTNGKLYAKLERDGSHVMWGNFKSEISGTEYLRNERTLYGAQVVYRSIALTANGDPKVELQAFAAQPDTLPGRDVFLGTGGSTYFLKYQDITRGSETILVEVRDPVSGRVLTRKTLVYGIDYDINYVQGLILLRAPLSSNANSENLVVGNPNGDNRAYLVANYEHTDTGLSLDTQSYGGRVQTWVTDAVRVGVTAQSEELGTDRQNAYGVDLLYRVSEQTFAELEFAKTQGVGASSDLSFDGGLTTAPVSGLTGTGHAVRFKGQVDFADLGAPIEGFFGAYFEKRDAGFSTLNHQVTYDEQLAGVYAEFEPSDQLSVRTYFDSFKDATGVKNQSGGIEVTYRPNEKLTWDLAFEHVDKRNPNSPSGTGKRIDAATRLTYTPNDDLTVYAFAQGTLKRSGTVQKNDRYGAGAEVKLGKHWRLSGEVSDGTTGVGARALASYDRDENNSYYFGYTLDAPGNTPLNGRDKGSYVIGARRQVNDSVSIFAENTYDLFGSEKSLTSAYGVTYEHSDYLTLTGGFEFGQVKDADSGADLDRKALSFGMVYRDASLNASARFEHRIDRSNSLGSGQDASTWAVTSAVKYEISDQARLLFAFDGVQSENADASIPDATFAEGSIGYAFRPTDNDRLNVLAKYTFLYDMTDRPSLTTEDTQPRQRAHIFSVDASYDLNEKFTLGGKIGGRVSSQSTNGGAFTRNDAALGVLNLRYHAVHNWDALFEVRALKAKDIGVNYGAVAAVYRHVGDNVKVGMGYNFGKFSSDLSDVTYNDKGVFVNIIAKF